MEKYEPLVSAFAAQGKYAEVKMHCIEIGSRGYLANSKATMKTILESSQF